MVEPSPSPGGDDSERAEELRALARLLNDETFPAPPVRESEKAAEEEHTRVADTEVLSPVPGPAPATETEEEPYYEDHEDADHDDYVYEEPDEDALQSVPVEPEPSVAAQQAQGLIAERFQVVGLLGGGPHGAVWRVHDHENQGREAALKILRQEWSHEPKLLIGLQAHLERSGSLTHESVNRLRDVGRTNDGRIWLAFDLVQGEDLREVLKHRGALSPRHAFEVARQVLLGLEQGHALGIVHGDIRLDHVIMEDRVPWSEDNPYGVGIQLLDFGLRPLFEGTRPGKQSDLLAVGRMLAELLTGTRYGAEGPKWGGSQASPILSALSARARYVLDTALAEDIAERFEDATAFRQAIEATREWRSPRSQPWGWIAASIVFVALATVFALQLFTKKTGDVPIFAAEPGGVETVALTDYDQLKNELDEARAENEAEAFRLQGELDQVTVEVNKLRSESGDLSTRAESAESEAARLTTENTELRTDYDEIVSQLQATRSRVAELEALSRPVPQSRDPLFLAASYLERMIELVEAGDGAGAHAVMESFREDVTLRDAGITDSNFLDAWVGGVLAWQRLALETNDIERIPLAKRATAGYELAVERRLTFDVAAADWLRLDDPEGRPINLGGRLDASLDKLGARIGTASDELDARLGERWAELSTGDFSQDPAELVAIANWFGDDRLERYTGRFVDEIRGTAEPNGVLDVNALARFERLPAWAEAIASAPDLEWLVNGGELLLYAYTQRFYGAEGPSEVLPEIEVRFRNGDAQVSGWREELTIRTALLREDSPFPGPVGTRALYHTRSPEGLSSWLWETVQYDPEPPAGADRSWLVDQRFYDAAGDVRGRRQLRVYLRGKRLYEKDVRSTEVLDLGRLESTYQVRGWTPETMPAVPDTLPVRPEQVAQFQQLLEAGEWRCLVHADGTALTWYSSELGLVRHADPGRITRELVYAEMPR